MLGWLCLRSVRGLLVLVGRPDGRLFAFTKTETAVLLSCKQMSFVENLGANPEVVSVGSNPHFEPQHVFAHVALPSQGRPKFIDEFVYSQAGIPLMEVLRKPNGFRAMALS
jgi:hypothetical protein